MKILLPSYVGENGITRIGIDVHVEVILAARELSNKSIKYSVGSFEKVANEVDGNKAIDYLITLGFTHGGTEEIWVTPYHEVAEKNNIKHFVVDTIPENGASYFLDYKKILPENDRFIERMGPFLDGRRVKVWQKEL